jgi:H+/Cl- antiporter ClcA
MKALLKISICLAVLISAVALGGAAYLLSGMLNAGPLTRRDDYLQLLHSFHLWLLYSAIAVGITILLWWTYRRQNNAE